MTSCLCDKFFHHFPVCSIFIRESIYRSQWVIILVGMYVRTVRFTYSIDYYITLRHNVSQRNPSTFGWLQLNILSQPVLSSTLLQLRYQVGKFITTRMQSSIITPRRYVTFYFYLQKKCLQIWITLTPSMIRLQFEIL